MFKSMSKGILLLAVSACSVQSIDRGIVVAKFNYGESFYINIAERGAIVKCQVTKDMHRQITIGERRSC